MSKKNKLFQLFTLFITFFKIGLFTFGGGYAMIPYISENVVDKKKWLSKFELMDVITISEATPGPIAINTATFVGYKVAGIWGSIFSTLGLVLPSFGIIFAISLIYNQLLTITLFSAMFKGIKVAVIVLLLNAIIKLCSSFKINKAGILLFLFTLIAMLLLSFFSININNISLAFIGLGLVCGIVIELLNKKGDVK